MRTQPPAGGGAGATLRRAFGLAPAAAPAYAAPTRLNTTVRITPPRVPVPTQPKCPKGQTWNGAACGIWSGSADVPTWVPPAVTPPVVTDPSVQAAVNTLVSQGTTGSASGGGGGGSAGAGAVVEADPLEEILPFYRKRWFLWAVGGLALVGAATTTGVILHGR